jgi:hypothetical protein
VHTSLQTARRLHLLAQVPDRIVPATVDAQGNVLEILCTAEHLVGPEILRPVIRARRGLRRLFVVTTSPVQQQHHGQTCVGVLAVRVRRDSFTISATATPARR